jgi:hypothetical protein
MPSYRHKRGTRAQIDAAAAANGLRTGELYLMTDEARLTVATAAGAHQPAARQDESGGAALGGIITVTLPQGAGQLEWRESVTAAGVIPANRIFLSLATTSDDDENDAELLDIGSVQGAATGGAIAVNLAFLTPTSGPIKLNWSAF